MTDVFMGGTTAILTGAAGKVYKNGRSPAWVAIARS